MPPTQKQSTFPRKPPSSQPSNAPHQRQRQRQAETQCFGSEEEERGERERWREEPEPVILKGTNKAIEKVCGLALFFQGQDDLQVRVKTGSVGTVDDIVEEDGVTVKSEDEKEKDEGDELPESRVRWLSVVEVHISLK
ncbi:hypothetical protein G7Y79_00008g023330 [Physcia stellaris]|nr:hypothetical protein G7Y79_00008g023330 [Physcia stellaris]